MQGQQESCYLNVTVFPVTVSPTNLQMIAIQMLVAKCIGYEKCVKHLLAKL